MKNIKNYYHNNRQGDEQMKKRAVELDELEPLVQQSLNEILNENVEHVHEFKEQQNEVIGQVKNLFQDVSSTAIFIKKKISEIESSVNELDKQQKEIAQEVAKAEIEQDNEKAAQLEKKLKEVINNKMTLSSKLEAFDNTDPNFSEENRTRVMDAIDLIKTLEFSVGPIQKQLEKVQNLADMLEKYKNRLQKEIELAPKTVDFNAVLKRINTDGLLTETFITREARKYIQEGKENKVHNHSELEIVGMWLQYGAKNGFTEFCKEYITELLNHKNTYERKEQLEKEEKRRKHSEQLFKLQR